MFTRDDLLDVLIARLQGSSLPSSEKPGAPVARHPAFEGPKGRIFLSEYEIKKRLTGGGGPLTIPKDAIISPAALDWLTLKGVKIVRE